METSVTDAAASERSKALLRRFFDEVVNRGNADVIGELFAPQFVDGARRVSVMWREAFPDLVLAVDDIVAEGDRVTATVTIVGTHTGTLRLAGFPDVPPTGVRATWTGMDYVRIADGKIVERRSPRDLLQMLQQLGAVPRREGQ